MDWQSATKWLYKKLRKRGIWHQSAEEVAQQAIADGFRLHPEGVGKKWLMIRALGELGEYNRKRNKSYRIPDTNFYREDPDWIEPSIEPDPIPDDAEYDALVNYCVLRLYLSRPDAILLVNWAYGDESKRKRVNQIMHQVRCSFGLNGRNGRRKKNKRDSARQEKGNNSGGATAAHGQSSPSDREASQDEVQRGHQE